ncbi:MAG: prepilin peptidase [Alphaproteobacteria bacterium]
MSDYITLFFAMFYVASIIYAMITDFTQLRIPNIVSIALAAAFVPFALLGDGGWAHMWPNLLLAGGTFLVLFTFFALGWLGAGDVKLLSAVMLWAGLEQGPRLIVIVALLGGAFAVSLLVIRRAAEYNPWIPVMPVLGQVSRWARTRTVPYALPIGVGALWIAPAIFA